MSAASRFDDPLLASPGCGNIPNLPIGFSNETWKGVSSDSKFGMFLFINRVPDKKKCASCNRGTRLQFERGPVKWRRCRRCLTKAERAALDKMLERERKLSKAGTGQVQSPTHKCTCDLPPDLCICGLELIGL